MATLKAKTDTYGTLTRFILIAPEYHNKINTVIARGTARYNRSHRHWTMPPDPLIYRNILATIPNVRVDQVIVDYMNNLANEQQRFRVATRTTSPLAKNDGLWGGIQRSSVRVLEEKHKVILGHEMGTGKTVIACYGLKHIHANRVIVVCPNSVKWSWVDHLKEWANKDNIAVVDSSLTEKQARAMTDTIIRGKVDTRDEKLAKLCKKDKVTLVTNFAQLRIHKRILSSYDWDVVVIDEAHRIKNRKAGQTKAAVSVCNRSSYTWMLTGTPVRNKLMDVWQLLNICDPHRFKGYWNFINYHFDTIQTRFGVEILGLKNPDEFNAMLSQYMFTKTKEEALPDLPEKIYKDIRIPMHNRQEQVYRQMEQEFCIEVTKQIEKGGELEDVLLAGTVAVQLIRLRQLCLSPAILGSVPYSAKLDALEDLIMDMREQQEKFIIYTCFRSFIPYVLEILNKNKLPYGTIMGGQSSRDRMQVQRGLAEGKIQSIVGTIQSMGEGMNLQAATTAIFCDTDWVPAVNAQAEARIHRLGIKSSPTIIRLYHPETIDTDIMNACKKKQDLIDSTVGQVEVTRELLGRLNALQGLKEGGVIEWQ